jgi:predicted enzyme related to lactoylglutathione lyase
MEIIINIDVDDLEKAVSFYESALGLRAGRRLFDGSVAEMLGGPAPIYLLAKPAGSSAAAGKAARRDYARHWTPVHLDFIVDDISMAMQRAIGAGARLEQAVATFPWGKLAVLSDPFGHGFCLIEFPTREDRY